MKTFYRRNLPHYYPSHAVYFITFRVAGSLPKPVVDHLKKERDQFEAVLLKKFSKKETTEKLRQSRKFYFGKFDALLDGSSNGHRWLSDSRIANLTAEAIHYRDGKEYDLYAYCIMPNHVHLVIKLLDISAIVPRRGSSRYTLANVLENLKWYTALKANKLLNRSGAFWQHESYDHVVRNHAELERIIRYVLNNPVKAGLVKDWDQWKWSYCKM